MKSEVEIKKLLIKKITEFKDSFEAADMKYLRVKNIRYADEEKIWGNWSNSSEIKIEEIRLIAFDILEMEEKDFVCIFDKIKSQWWF